MEPLCTTRDTSWRVDETLHQGPGKVELPLPRCGQARQDGGFSASPRSQCRRRASLLSQSAVEVLTTMAAQDHARWSLKCAPIRQILAEHARGALQMRLALQSIIRLGYPVKKQYSL